MVGFSIGLLRTANYSTDRGPLIEIQRARLNRVRGAQERSTSCRCELSGSVRTKGEAMNHIKLTRALFGVVLITLLMFGCATSTAGKIEGVLVQKDTNKVLANRRIRLYQAIVDVQAKKVVIPGGLHTVGGKPIAETETDANGVLVFKGVQPGSYVLTALTVRPMGEFDALVSSDGKVIADVQGRIDGIDASGKQRFSSLVDANRVLLVEVKSSQALSLGNVVIEDTSR